MKKSPLYMTLTVALTMMTACSTSSEPVPPQHIFKDPHFWQRTETSSMIYQRGPKAQQMLNRDISRCVTELRELDRLGAIRYVTPADLYDDPVGEGEMTVWDTPERDGYLKAEHLEYHDFESCMMTKGWERVEHVPYDVAEEGRDAYVDAIIGQKYRTKTRQHDPFRDEPAGDSYDDLQYNY